MKIALSCKGNTLDSPLDERFGRAPNFIIYDLEKNTHMSIDNAQILNSPQGAGIQAAQNVVNSGAEVVITGHVGPKAYRTLSAAGVDIYFAKGSTVKETIEHFKLGKLSKAEGNDVEGHWV
ncbi:MAG: NifB/NifX family molybdenum-iron cluster-binding protein [Bacillota bacterium]